MIQSARSSSSRSLLREAESAILLIKDENVRNFFKDAIRRMIEKRQNPDLVFTGAKELKTNLLAYLSQHGEVKTANIWCRKIIYSQIKTFLKELEAFLIDKGLVGVVELHLQDREINSPHIQYVGIKAEEAQRLIAEFLVVKNYEDSLESAIMSNYTPAYISEEPGNLQVKATDEEITKIEQLEAKEKYIKELKQSIQASLAEISGLKSSFLNILKTEVRAEIKQDRRKQKIRIENRQKTTSELLEEWQHRKARKQR